MTTLTNDNSPLSDKEKLFALLLEEKQNEVNGGILKADRTQPLSLSFTQERLWFLEQLDPGSLIYNLRGSLVLTGHLDVDALKNSFQDVIARHEILRTTFTALEGAPIQVVKDVLHIDFPILDLTDQTEAEQDAEIAAIYGQEATTSFDLETGPLLRLVLIKVSATEHRLLMTIHHIISDDWGLTAFFRDLSEFYKARVTQCTPSLEPIEYQYADLAHTQRQEMQGQRQEDLLAYWKKQLADIGGPLDLPSDRPRPAIQSFKGDQFCFSVPADRADRLRKFSRDNKVTLFMTMLAVFKTFLHRYTGRTDILVGTAVAHRDRVEMENLVGVFVNNLVLRTNLSGNPDFLTLLGAVNGTCLAAFEHQSLPFERLVEELKPKRDRSRNPLFQIAFVYLNASDVQVSLDGLNIVPTEEHSGASEYDLSLYVRDQGEDQALECRFDFSTALFEKTTIERMGVHYQTLLAGITSNPQQKLSELPLLNEKEREKILIEWNQTSADYPFDQTLHELFEAQVDRTPEVIAVEFGDQSLTYLELDERANRIAHYLRENGVVPGQLVGVFMERSLEMVVALYGVIKSGGAYVPLDPDYPSARIAFMMEDTQVPVLLTQQHLRERLPDSPSKVLCVDTEWDAVAGKSNARIPDASTFGDNAYVIYTSGSTGKPKGVMNCHQGIVNRLLWMQERYQLQAEDRILQKTPFSFDVSVWEFFWPLITGARLVVANPGGHKDPFYLAGLIEERQITTLHFVPSMLQTFLEHADIGASRNLKRVICSGEALSYDLQEQFFRVCNAELHNLYGPTEAAVDVTSWECRRQGNKHVVPIGRPIANTRIYILDKNLQPVPVGIPGELHIAGVQVARGYLNRPALTEEKFIADPFSEDKEARLYKTGDLARHLPDGEVEYLGRMDHQVKLRGFRIELGEIETALRKHEAVNDAVVDVRGDVNDRRLVTWLLASGDARPASGDMSSFLAESLPDYMVPNTYVWLEQYPETSNGKIDRKALPAPSPNKSNAMQENHVAPESPLELLLVNIFQEVLQVEGVGCYDNFFDLGGHSLLSMKVVARFEKETDIRMHPGELFQQTIGQIAAFHEQAYSTSQK